MKKFFRGWSNRREFIRPLATVKATLDDFNGYWEGDKYIRHDFHLPMSCAESLRYAQDVLDGKEMSWYKTKGGDSK